ncbi:MAG: peptidoglycan DD-metalloendopeptidase family protein [Acetobacter sp.]|nr:peptidoglycan DD-metalloendopeptidase family protein [Acetobacter sp.]
MIVLQKRFVLCTKSFKQKILFLFCVFLSLSFASISFTFPAWGEDLIDLIQHAKQHSHHNASSQANIKKPETRNPEEENALLAIVHAKRKNLDKERSQQEITTEQLRLHSKETQALATLSRQKAETLSRASHNVATQLLKTEHNIAIINAQIQTIHTDYKTLKKNLQKEVSVLLTILPPIDDFSHHPLATALAPPREENDAMREELVLRGFSRYMQQRIQNTLQHQKELQEHNNALATTKMQLAQIEHTQQQQHTLISQQASQAREQQKQAEEDAHIAREQLQRAIQQAASLQDAIARLETLENTTKAVLQRETFSTRRHSIKSQEEANKEILPPPEAPSLETPTSETPQIKTPQETPIPPPSAPLLHINNSVLKPHTSIKSPSQIASQRSSHTITPIHPLITHTPFDINHALHPVPGTLITRWGAPTETGPATSMIYNTSLSALVRAPCSGSVDFAGVFRSYGQMIILNCGRHYRFILAGLSELSVNTGQKLLKGAQLGHMGSTSTTTRLLLQLRHGQQIINPASFL